jgi:hypothetical protein
MKKTIGTLEFRKCFHLGNLIFANKKRDDQFNAEYSAKTNAENNGIEKNH